ncbi:MAG TPA: HDOD domain-containing protein [Gammaproteobacteria bacterium]|nr:HDOD domain-containing protein [Gammaproteobacteria bacterium]
MSSSAPITIDEITARALPVFTHSVHGFQRLRTEKTAPWEKYGDIILKDPGLALQTLKQLQQASDKPREQEIASMEQAAMLLGLERVHRLPTECPQIDETLQGLAREGYPRAVARAFHAAYQAWDWAYIKRDHAPDEVLLSALMHDSAELALWVNAPQRIHQLRRLTLRDRMPSAEAQYIALGDSLEHFGRRLAEKWNLPQLVHEALRPEYSNEPRVRGVVLAVQLARQVEWGWYSPQVQETLEMIADYLEASLEETTTHVHRAAVRAAHEAAFYSASAPAALLPRVPGDEQFLINEEFPPQADDTSVRHPSTAATEDSGPATDSAIVCLSPQPAIFDTIRQEMQAGIGKLEINDMLRKAIHGMHDGAGLNRALFAMLSADRNYLQARFLIGTDSDPYFNRFRIRLDQPHLFKRLMEKPQSIRIHDGNREKFWGLVPSAVKTLIKTNSFCAQSVHINGKPVGLFYADRHSQDCDLDETTYQRFRQMCQLAVKGMAAKARQRA